MVRAAVILAPDVTFKVAAQHGLLTSLPELL